MKTSHIKYFRWILGGVLMVAGVLKIINPENLVEVLLFFGVPEEVYAYIFTYMVSIFEIILGILLIVKKVHKSTYGIAFATYLVFLGISMVGYLDNWQFACGCLGRFSFGKFDINMVIRNTVLVLMAGWVLFENNIYKKLLRG